MCSQLQRDSTSQQVKLPRCDRFSFGLFEKIFADKISGAVTDRTALAKAIAALAAGRERQSAAKLYLAPTVLSADLSAAWPRNKINVLGILWAFAIERQTPV
jgi:hypothetical protein